ncbi:MAG: hypothetical protein JWM74_1209, partial [Myxococcaceae bacterium]|nr:hypothetical protein [Myxococcaceae bacterium]
GGATLLNEGPKSSAPTCSCTCSGNPCFSNQASNIQWRTGNSSCNDGVNSILLSGACTTFTNGATGGGINGGGFAPPGTGGPKACTDNATLPSVAFDSTVRVCNAPAIAGGGCASGESCEPTPAPARLCLQHDGDVACATGTKHLIGAPAAVKDDRACGACGCSANACTNQKVEFFSDTACATLVATVPSTGNVNTCPDATGTVTGAARYKYAATPNCTPATPNPPATGALTFTTSTTLCCSP